MRLRRGGSRRHLRGRTALQADTEGWHAVRGRCPRLLTVQPSRLDSLACQRVAVQGSVQAVPLSGGVAPGYSRYSLPGWIVLLANGLSCRVLCRVSVQALCGVLCRVLCRVSVQALCGVLCRVLCRVSVQALCGVLCRVLCRVPPSLPLFVSLTFRLFVSLTLCLFSRYHLCSKSILAWKAIP